MTDEMQGDIRQQPQAIDYGRSVPEQIRIGRVLFGAALPLLLMWVSGMLVGLIFWLIGAQISDAVVVISAVALSTIASFKIARRYLRTGDKAVAIGLYIGIGLHVLLVGLCGAM